MLKKTLVLMGSVFIMSCGPVSFSGNKMEGAPPNTPSSPQAPTQADSGVPSCEVDIPQLHIQGNVDAFNFVSSLGFSFGWNKTETFQGNGGSLQFTLSKAEMIMSLQAIDPFNAGQWTASVMPTANQHNVDISGTVNFAGAHTGGHWNLPEPLERVTQAGLNLGISELNTGFNKATAGLITSGPQNWTARVLELNGSNQVVVNAGSLAGILDGDTFAVYNVNHIWNGTPCASTHYGEERTGTAPVATIVAHPSTATTSIADVVTGDGTKITPGAEVVILFLVNNTDNTRALKKKAIYDGIISKSFSVEDQNGKYVEFPFQDVINDQMKTLLDNQNNYFWTP